MGKGLRYRFSGLTSAALAVVLAFLPYVPQQFFYLHLAAIIVFLADALVKVFDIVEIRPYTSALYSVFLGLILLTYFKVFGTPISELTALLLFYDAYLKVREGNQRTIFGVDERTFRHTLSAILTTFLGLGVLFGVGLPYMLNVLLGLLLLVDGVLKLEYVRIL